MRRAIKPSGVDWIGDIPADWTVQRLKFVATFAYGDALAAEARTDGSVSVYGSNGVVGNHDRANTVGDTVIIGRKGSHGKINRSPAAAFAIDTTYFVDERFTAANIAWLYHLLGCLRLDAISKDSAVPGLAREDAYEKRCPVPSLDEQKQVADFLDRETARIDALIDKKRRLLELLEEKRLAIITHAVTKGLDPSAPMKDSGIDWLGQIPAHWELRPIAGIQRRITYGFTNPMPTEDDGPYMLTANDIDYGRIRYETARRTSQDAFDRDLTDKSRPRKNDLLLTKDGTLGRVALYDGLNQVCINQSVALIRLQEELVRPSFVALALMSTSYQDMMLFNAGGTTIKHIYITRLAKMPFAYPPIAEQDDVLCRVELLLAPLRRLIASTMISINFLEEYRAALITNAVTGKIDVRGAAEKEAAA